MGYPSQLYSTIRASCLLAQISHSNTNSSRLLVFEVLASVIRRSTANAHVVTRSLLPGGRLVTVDWTKSGNEAAGPPLGERHDLGHAVSAMTDAGFTVDHAVSRTETFVCRARL